MVELCIVKPWKGGDNQGIFHKVGRRSLHTELCKEWRDLKKVGSLSALPTLMNNNQPAMDSDQPAMDNDKPAMDSDEIVLVCGQSSMSKHVK